MGEHALPDALIGLMSIISFAAFAVDKALARMYMPRIADKHLHLLTALGGFPGSFLAMVVFRYRAPCSLAIVLRSLRCRGTRHKTRKLLFWSVLLLAAVLWSTLHPFWLDTVGKWLLQAAGLPERCGGGRQPLACGLRSPVSADPSRAQALEGGYSGDNYAAAPGIGPGPHLLALALDRGRQRGHAVGAHPSSLPPSLELSSPSLNTSSMAASCGRDGSAARACVAKTPQHTARAHHVRVGNGFPCGDVDLNARVDCLLHGGNLAGPTQHVLSLRLPLHGHVAQVDPAGAHESARAACTLRLHAVPCAA